MVQYYAHTIVYAAAMHLLRAITDSELWHLCLSYTHPRKLATMSLTCKGITHPLASYTHPSHNRQEANAVAQGKPMHIDHTDDKDIWHVNEIDMGEKYLTKAGYRYATLIVIIRTRYVLIFLHRCKSEAPTILLRAFAKMGRTPDILRGNGEYKSAPIIQICLEKQIDGQFANSHQQFQNAPAEPMVRHVNEGIRVTLNSANLSQKFWGFAAINYIDIHNHLPHASLDNKTPWECEKGTLPDVSWFRPFGCRATVYISDNKKQLWHCKLAPQGIPAVYMGLGFSRGQKGWMCYDPIRKEVYCSRNVVFDETFFPMRICNQQVLGHYDTTPRCRLATAAYGSMEAKT